MAGISEYRLFRDAREKAFLTVVENALAELQPGLLVIKRDNPFVIEGMFSLNSPEGIFDEYRIRIVLDKKFPEVEPIVFEAGKRIPLTYDRHINPGGNCCVTVWENWLAMPIDHSFREYLDGPLRDFFLNQFFFEKTGEWRFGERPHFAAGMVEAFAETLGVQADQTIVTNYLKSLAAKPKGHLACPCGSGKILRHCHQNQLHELHKRLPAKLAKRMLDRLTKSP